MNNENIRYRRERKNESRQKKGEQNEKGKENIKMNDTATWVQTQTADQGKRDAYEYRI